MPSLSILAQGDSLFARESLDDIPRPICAVNTVVNVLREHGITPDYWAWQDDAREMDARCGAAVRGVPLRVWSTTVGLNKKDWPDGWTGSAFTRRDQCLDVFGEQPWQYEDIQIPRSVVELAMVGWPPDWAFPTVHAATMHALRSGFTDITIWFADMYGGEAKPYADRGARPDDYFQLRWYHERKLLAWCMRAAARMYGATVRRAGHTIQQGRPVVDWTVAEALFLRKQDRLRAEGANDVHVGKPRGRKMPTPEI